jgi:hypothetical protein
VEYSWIGKALTGSALLTVFLLTACGSSNNSDESGQGEPSNTQYSVSVTVSGLNSSGLVLQNNGTDDLAIEASGLFSFTTTLMSGSNYSVTILTQPDGQNCSVTNGNGTVTNDVADIQVSCISSDDIGNDPDDTLYPLSGMVTGLAGNGLVLQNNGADDLTIDADGSFSFSTSMANGAHYLISILSQPEGQNCSVSNGDGTVYGAVVDILISCLASGAPTLSVASGGPKLLSFSWNDVGADHYRLMKNSDGASGYSQVGEPLQETQMDKEIAVHLTDWKNARYLLQTCNAADDCIDSESISIDQHMLQSVGYIKASDTSAEIRFGGKVVLAADGNTLAVGIGEESNVSKRAVYIYTHTETGWLQQARLQASNDMSSFSFGTSLAISADGNVLVVGDPYSSSNATGQANSVARSGSAFVFQRSGSEWQQTAHLKAWNPGVDDYLGYSLTLSADGTVVAVGAIGEDSDKEGARWDDSTPNAGAVFLFGEIDGSWSQQAVLKAPNAEAYDSFGSSLAISGDGNILAVAAKYEESSALGVNGDQTDNSVDGAGAVYIFERDQGEWSHQSYIKASNTEENDVFGEPIALSADGNTLAVAAYREDSSATGIDGDQQDNTSDASGAVYLFTYEGDTWTQQAYIKASNPDTRIHIDDWWPGDYFGYSLSLSENGALLAVGAVGEDSAAIGVNGDQQDNSIGSPGAAYLFAKGDNGWYQQTYMKAPNTDRGVYDEDNWFCDWVLPPIGCPETPGDSFGSSVSLSGDGKTLAVGAMFEDSATTGIGGNQEDNSAADSGAVYLY